MYLKEWIWILVMVKLWILKVINVDGCNTWVNLESRGTFDEPSSHQPYLRTLNGNLLECHAACMLMDTCRSVFFTSSTEMCILSKWDKFSEGPTFSESNSATYSMYRKKGGFQSCSGLKSAHPGAGNGEYWLYPSAPSILSNAVKIYCADMDTQNPKEYITLPTPNVGNVPKKFTYDCKTIYNYMYHTCNGRNSETTYSKIRVAIYSMEVARNDKTFASSTGPVKNYGIAYDCYVNGKRCAPVGTFVINTIGTGLIVSTSVTWIPYGFNGHIGHVSISVNGAVISLLCGGWAGGCKPNGPMTLEYNLNEDVRRQLLELVLRDGSAWCRDVVLKELSLPSYTTILTYNDVGWRIRNYTWTLRTRTEKQ